MTLRQRKRMLWTINVALATAIVVTVAAAALLPLAAAPQDAGPNDPAKGEAKVQAPRTGPLEAYAGIYRRDLRKPLYDVKAVPAITPPKPKPKMTVALVGTALEPGFTYGMFRTKSGQTKLVRVGETVEGVEVLQIAQESATVRFAGEVLELKVPKRGGR